MALVSISEAARRVGLSRTQLYRGYIAQGKISTVTAAGKTPQIDTSELQRVFGELKLVTDTDTVKPSRTVTDSKTVTEVVLLRQELKFVREQLHVERVHSEKLEQTLKLLELKQATKETTATEQDIRLQQLQSQVENLKQGVELLLAHQTAAQQHPAPEPPRRGFWSKLFGKSA